MTLTLTLDPNPNPKYFENFSDNFFQKCSWVHVRCSLMVILYFITFCHLYKISKKLIGIFTVFLHQSSLLSRGYPMMPISHLVISGQPPVTLTLQKCSWVHIRCSLIVISLKFYPFVTPHRRRPILWKFYRHKFFQNCSWVHIRCSLMVISLKFFTGLPLTVSVQYFENSWFYIVRN